MKRLLDNLIGYMRAVVVAGVDMVYAGGDHRSENSNRGVDVRWRSPNFRAGKLDRAVAHPVQADCGARKREGATELRLFRHCVSLRFAVLNSTLQQGVP